MVTTRLDCILNRVFNQDLYLEKYISCNVLKYLNVFFQICI